MANFGCDVKTCNHPLVVILLFIHLVERFGAGVYLQLLVNIANVRANRFSAYEKLVGNFLVAKAF